MKRAQHSAALSNLASNTSGAVCFARELWLVTKPRDFSVGMLIDHETRSSLEKRHAFRFIPLKMRSMRSFIGHIIESIHRWSLPDPCEKAQFIIAQDLQRTASIEFDMGTSIIRACTDSEITASVLHEFPNSLVSMIPNSIG